VLNEEARRIAIYLNALRAFEAAARLQTFSAAAEELNVTPPAISQLIKTLEDYVGRSLFERSRSGVTLTPEAAAIYPQIRDGFSLLAEGLQRLRTALPVNVVTLSVTPAFASKWLLTRISGFSARYPQWDIRLHTTDRLVDFRSEGVDIGVRFGIGRYPDLTAERMMGEYVFPVCSQNLLDKLGKPSLSLDDIAFLTLIHDATISFDPNFPTWTSWLSSRGYNNIHGLRGMHVNASALAIQAAIEGHGVALARSRLVKEDLVSGRLVRPFDGYETSHSSYFVVYPHHATLRPQVKAVRDWLMSEAEEEQILTTYY
jgi:LysR family glycine cleavage system transcriptional activator